MASILIESSTTLHRFASVRIDFESVPRRHCIMSDRFALICNKFAPMSRRLAPALYRYSIDAHAFTSIILRFASTSHGSIMNLASISHRCTWIHLGVYRFRTDILSIVVNSASIRIVGLHRVRTDVAPISHQSVDLAPMPHPSCTISSRFASASHRFRIVV